MIIRPDQCPQCGSLNWSARNADGTRFDQSKQHGLWAKMKCQECAHIWPFTIVHVVESVGA
jgi:hypothetical protein